VKVLSNQIKAKANDLGFSFCGITGIHQTPHANAFINWLGKGYAGEMNYLNSPYIIKARLDPTSLLKNAQSAIIAGIHYLPKQDLQIVDQDYPGNIASYAMYKDYHEVLKEKIKALMDWIAGQSYHQFEYRIFIDSGPVMEKDFALQAGLGMIGKNSLLYHPEYGSFVVLGCAFTNLKLHHDHPIHSDFCGSCTRCIQACPTNCILDNRTIDARKCISYLTIEHKGIIPLELRSKIGTHIFGCDICQTACPENSRKSLNSSPALPKVRNSEIFLLEESMLGEQDYIKKYENSPLDRLSHENYLRNLIIAMGNLHREEFVERLEYLLINHKSPIVRAHAAWALGNSNNQANKQFLGSMLSLENNPIVKKELRLAISQPDC